MHRRQLLLFATIFVVLATFAAKPVLAAEDTTECFMKNQPDKTFPLIDWQSVRTPEALEKASTIIADRLQDRHTLTRWMAANGFKTISPISMPASSMRWFTDVVGDGWQVTGTQPRKDIRLKLAWYQKI
jgi:hypothetical protein